MERVRQATASVAVALDTIGYRYRYYDELNSFILEFGLKKSRLTEVQVVVNVREDSVGFHSVCMIKVPREQRERVAVYLTCCNFDLVYGNFEMNMSDGEVRFKNVLSYHECMPSRRAVEETLNLTVAMFDRYGDGLLSVIYANKDPKQAALEAERHE